MRREMLIAIVSTAIASSAGTAFAVELVRPDQVDAAAGDTRIVRELRQLNFSVGRTDSQSPPPRSLREQLRQICKNTTPAGGLSSLC